MSDPITVTHTPSGSVLHITAYATLGGTTELRLAGGDYWITALTSELEFPPTPRPLPTHVGARIEVTYADGGRDLWIFDGTQWICTDGDARDAETMQWAVGKSDLQWVELVPKTGDGAE
jgi:hypothetical protein